MRKEGLAEICCGTLFYWKIYVKNSQKPGAKTVKIHHCGMDNDMILY